MKIKILGTRGEIPESVPYHSKQSGVLIDDVLLLDLGEKSFLQTNPKWILITHFHPDHAYFVRKKREEIPQTRAQIFGPEIPLGLEKVVQLLNTPKKLGPYQITPIPTHHSKRVKSQAYLIKKGKRKLLYTGDLVWINKEYHRLFKNVDLIITEASFVRKGGMVKKDPVTHQLIGHNGVPDLMRLFHTHTKKLLLVHFGSWFFKNTQGAKWLLKKLGREQGVEVIVGYDGQLLELTAV